MMSYMTEMLMSYINAIHDTSWAEPDLNTRKRSGVKPIPSLLRSICSPIKLQYFKSLVHTSLADLQMKYRCCVPVSPPRSYHTYLTASAWWNKTGYRLDTRPLACIEVGLRPTDMIHNNMIPMG